MKIAKERKSSVLASNAVHHRIDSLTSIVALAAIVGSNVLTNISWLDPVGGLLVSLLVIRAGWDNTKNAFFELADVGMDSEIKASIQRAAAKALIAKDDTTRKLAYEKVEVREVQGIKAGQNYLVNIELGVPEEWTVKQTRPVEGLVRERVGAKVRGVRRVRVKFVSKSEQTPDFADEFIGPDVSPRSSPEPEEGHDHDHDHGHDHASQGGHSNGDVKNK